MNDANTATVVRQLMDALAYLHANDFVHRDVKPENILMMSKDPKSPHFNRILLSDFGMAQQRPNIHTNVLKTLIGTPEFSAPEVLAIARHGCTPGVPNSTQYSCAIDLWAAGCVTYTMLSSTTPFTSHKGANVPGMIDRIMHGRYSFAAAAWSNVSAQAIDIIRRLLTVAPAKRLTAPQALYHPFLYTPGQQDEEPLHVLGEELPPLATRRSGSMDRTGLSAKQSVLQSRIAAMGGSSFATFANMATISGGMGQDDSFTMRQSPFQATTPLAGGRTPSLRGSVSPSVASGTPTQHHASPSHRIPGSPQQSHLPPPSPGSHTSSSPPVHRVTSFGAPYPHGHNHPPSPGNPGAASPSHHAHDLGVKRDSVLQYREITTSGDMGDTSDRSVDSRAITSQHSSRGQGSFDKNTNPVEQARHRGSMNSTPVVLTPTGMDKTTFAKELSGVSAGSPAPISGGGGGTPPVPSGGKPPRSGSSRKMRVEMSPTASPVRLADPVG
uniref:Protein kinase domain-containing protein n=2 Tax=Hemiselmis andersenii TaxID=464988 RepID=A0A7S1HCW4_HEMAN|mmetsp:Transcript_52606/g.127385  ORF Transcript_52606/g.127385 Transcript_52606/m.127385 type:complete len:497 (+) Transcript_52606:433-1923(+)